MTSLTPRRDLDERNVSESVTRAKKAHKKGAPFFFDAAAPSTDRPLPLLNLSSLSPFSTSKTAHRPAPPPPQTQVRRPVRRAPPRLGSSRRPRRGRPPQPRGGGGGLRARVGADARRRGQAAVGVQGLGPGGPAPREGPAAAHRRLQAEEVSEGEAARSGAGERDVGQAREVARGLWRRRRPAFLPLPREGRVRVFVSARVSSCGQAREARVHPAPRFHRHAEAARSDDGGP